MNKKSLWRKPSLTGLQRKEAGFAIGLVLTIFVILIVIGIGLLNLGLQGRLQAVRAASEISAKCAADAGLTKSLFEMNKKLAVKPWSEGVLPSATNESLPNSDATFSYTVTGSVDGGYIVESVGRYGRAEKTVRSILRLAGLFEKAVFTQGSLELKNGTVVDSYNNDAEDGNMLIGTNSTTAGSLIMKSGVTIEGDIAVGAGGDPALVIVGESGATVTGEIYTMAETYAFPPITVPDSLVALPKSQIKATTKTISGNARYDNINLGNSQIVQITGPSTIYVSGNVDLSNSAQLQIVNGGSLTMYVGGSFVSKNGGLLNNVTQDPTKLRIYGLDGCKKFDLMTDGTFYGAIYAPNADLKSHNSVEIFGSVAAKSFTQSVSAGLHYDAALNDVTVNDVGVRFVVTRWYEE
jgi:hypothetical protein